MCKPLRSAKVGDKVYLLRDCCVRISTPDVMKIPNSQLGLPFNKELTIAAVEVWDETWIFIKVEGSDELLRMKRFSSLSCC